MSEPEVLERMFQLIKNSNDIADDHAKRLDDLGGWLNKAGENQNAVLGLITQLTQQVLTLSERVSAIESNLALCQELVSKIIDGSESRLELERATAGAMKRLDERITALEESITGDGEQWKHGSDNWD
jgi:hypothetical protein